MTVVGIAVYHTGKRRIPAPVTLSWILRVNMVGCAAVFMSFHAIMMLFGSNLIENNSTR